MSIIITLVRVVLAILALRGVRWAYVSFIVLGLAYFPAKVGFRFDPHPCQLTFGVDLALHSLTNYPHIILFGIFFLVSYVHFAVRRSRRPMLTAAAITLVMGALVEIAQGVTGSGNCRSRDLIPDAVGILLGATVVVVVRPLLPRVARWRETHGR